MRSILNIVQIVAVLGTISSSLYYLLCLWSAARFLGERKAESKPAPQPSEAEPLSVLPPITILKPLKGTDPEMYESFRSHCLQDYPDYEIIFGVSDANDPAAELVRRLQAEFPQHNLRLMVCPERLGSNTKVSNLAQMVREARHEYLVVNDSDIRIAPDYLRRILTPLAQP